MTPYVLKAAINEAFHVLGCDALYPLADSKIPYREELLTQEDIQRTVWMMGYDYLLWARELQGRAFDQRRAWWR